eukprot:5184308-Amphidinium_carterae.1
MAMLTTLQQTKETKDTKGTPTSSNNKQQTTTNNSRRPQTPATNSRRSCRAPLFLISLGLRPTKRTQFTVS